MDINNKKKYITDLKFYDLYKEIKNKIKDKVITKLLLIVQNQHKELLFLRKENAFLKNHLSYILKRIILQKDECKCKVGDKIINHGSIAKIKKSLLFNNSSIDNYRNNSFKPQKSVENKLSKNLNDSIDNDYIYEQNNNTINTNNSSVNQKVERYLNTIYRNNFINSSNASLSNNLNKSETIYNELFQNDKNIKIIRNLKLKNKENSKIKDNKDQALNFDFREKQLDDNEYNNNCMTENNFYSRNKMNKKNKINYGKNSKNNYGEKIKAKKDLLYIKRSPFLVNKY